VFETNLVVVGNVLSAPEWRRTARTGSLVANFRIASTARRFDRASNTWVDGDQLRIRVSAWRRLAEGVASSITVGDPLIVYGRLYTRDWKDDNGTNRVSYEMEALSIGHDLAKGRAKFFRQKALPGGSTIEDGEAEQFVAGEPTIALTGEEVPVGYGEGLPDEEVPAFSEPPDFAEPPAELSPVATASGAAATSGDEPLPPAGEAAPSGGGADDDFTLEVERLTAQPGTTTRRNRRSAAKREPVAA
jgi:single-strand DNA-binding protein